MHIHEHTPHMLKPRLIDLVNKHRISMFHLARVAQVRISVVHAMTLRCEPVQPVVAVQVLNGLLKLTGRRYLLTDVDMPIVLDVM